MFCDGCVQTLYDFNTFIFIHDFFPWVFGFLSSKRACRAPLHTPIVVVLIAPNE
jgi:hypothetical protein